MRNCDLLFKFSFVGEYPSAPKADFRLERLSFLLRRLCNCTGCWFILLLEHQSKGYLYIIISENLQTFKQCVAETLHKIVDRKFSESAIHWISDDTTGITAFIFLR